MTSTPFRVTLLSLAVAAVATAQPTVRARYAAALTYEQFLRADTARHEQWQRNTARAEAVVAPFVARARALPGRWHLLVVAEATCGDALNSVPWLARLADEVPTLDLRLLHKADAADLLAAHRLGDREATPLVLVYDDSWVERGAWIERPLGLRSLIESEEGHVPDDTLTAHVRAWRADDNGASVLREVLGLIERRASSAGNAAAAAP